MRAKIDEQVEASPRSLRWSRHWSTSTTLSFAAQENRSLLARDEDLPSGEELGAEFERFLAEHADEYKGEPRRNRRPDAGWRAAAPRRSVDQCQRQEGRRFLRWLDPDHLVSGSSSRCRLQVGVHEVCRHQVKDRPA